MIRTEHRPATASQADGSTTFMPARSQTNIYQKCAPDASDCIALEGHDGTRWRSVASEEVVDRNLDNVTLVNIEGKGVAHTTTRPQDISEADWLRRGPASNRAADLLEQSIVLTTEVNGPHEGEL